MADVNNASSVYLKDKGGSIILPATDWSVINNKPNNLATTDQLPADSGWKDGNLMNGTTGLFKYRRVGQIVFMYAQLKDYPVTTDTPVADNAAIVFPKFNDVVGANLISDWVSVDGDAKAQVGFKLNEGFMVVYRIEGSKSTIRFYKSFVIDD